jgi:hypothetical protein
VCNPHHLNQFGIYAMHKFDDASIEVMSFSDRRKKTLVRGGTYGRYLSSGHLLYVNRGTLFAVPFDVARWRLVARPHQCSTKSLTTTLTGVRSSERR